MSICCDVGTYECYELVGPCEMCNHPIYADKCLVDEVKSLRKKSITTIGCCCGHGKQDAYIQVKPEHVEKMLELGYEQQEPYGDMGLWCFWPKSKLKDGDME